MSIDTVAARIVALVAEQTGYPAEMLALDLDLEADLGIDTVKQAELFATIREEYGIERDDKLQLRDYPTLNHVLGFVRDRTPPHTPTVTAHARRPAPAASSVGASERRCLPTSRSRRRAAPVARALRCRPGSRSDAGSRVVVMADSGGVGGALVERLHQRGVETLVVDDMPRPPTTLVARLASWRESGPITGVYWLPALDDEGPHAALDADTWREGLRVRVKLLRGGHARAVQRHRRARHVPRHVPPASVGSTATGRQAPARRWAVPSPASPRPTPASGPTRW